MKLLRFAKLAPGGSSPVLGCGVKDKDSLQDVRILSCNQAPELILPHMIVPFVFIDGCLSTLYDVIM